MANYQTGRVRNRLKFKVIMTLMFGVFVIAYDIDFADAWTSICLPDKPNVCLHIENGTLETGKIDKGWQSARWTYEPGPVPNQVKIRNVWKNDIYLHIENGKLEASAINPEWLSALWTITETGIQNVWKPERHYTYKLDNQIEDDIGYVQRFLELKRKSKNQETDEKAQEKQ